MNFKEKFRAYIDLTRAHFAPVWPLLFLSGVMLAFRNGNFFSWPFLILVAFIGLFGFEAGMVLNDIVDHNLDKLDTSDDNLTKYWRPFNERPIPSGKISFREAVAVYISFVIITVILIAFLPLPNMIYLYGFLIYGHSMEVFYQVKKRNQKFPIAQLLGRTDLTLFPVAGYLCFGQFNPVIIFYILFLYPFAQAHLGVNDIADWENDKAKDLKTITVLYGAKSNIMWILGFTGIHLFTATLFVIFVLSPQAIFGFAISFVLLIGANAFLLMNKTPQAGLKVLPMFHMSLLVYILTIIVDSALVLI